MAPPEIKPNLLQADISMRPANWLLHLESLNGAYSENTLRAYRSDFQAFESWCSNYDHIALPAVSKTIAAFIEFQRNEFSPSTIRRRLSGISKLHLLVGHKDPTVSVDVKLALRRMYRKKGR